MEDFEAGKKKAGDKYNSISTTEVDTNTIRETEVRIDETTTTETDIQAAAKETEIEIVTKETGVEEINDITVEINESVVMADEVQRETINVTIDLETKDKETTKTDNLRREGVCDRRFPSQRIKSNQRS